MPVTQLCREQGISESALYKWKSKLGGMDVSEAKRLRQLEEENSKLKRLLADAILDNAALKDLLSKNGEAPLPRKKLRLYIVQTSSAFAAAGLPTGQYSNQAHIESFNRTLRKECLGWSRYRPAQIPLLQAPAEEFLQRYHNHRPHLAFKPMRPPLNKY